MPVNNLMVSSQPQLNSELSSISLNINVLIKRKKKMCKFGSFAGSRESRKETEHLTHYHVLAVLTVGGLPKDMVLEAVCNLRSGRLGGQRWGKAE